MSRNSGSVQNQDFEDYVSSVKQKSEELIKNVFPKRIVELNEILDSPLFNLDVQKQGLSIPLNIPVPDAQAISKALNHTIQNNHNDEEESPAGKKRKLNNVKNGPIVEDQSIIATGTKVLALPEGQVTVNKTISKMFDVVKPQIRQLVEYSNLLAKYPIIEDYRRVIAEIDEKEFISLRLIISEIRNHYASLFDLISKNWEKIIKPRTSNSENLY
ncbi:Proteasome activator complex subunit 3 [Folsomia candida]|uniref:Proteasome activator complex subunit 3 n=1 Tax=Folsomia candida TaxID=158441 RepID=A0A226E5F4_FOLCA|nr:Proteasome activator complex subunit 3 [Folsomia candida]